jgi:branched-subunit amino acid permease
MKLILMIACLTIGIGLTSCEKECLSEFKKEMKNEFSNCDSSSSENFRKPAENK